MSNLSTFPPLRLSLPSKGRLAEDAVEFLNACGLRIYKPNPRQYEATIPALPGLNVLFQRPADIVVSVRDGSVDFGITGIDVIAERRGENGHLMILHEALGFGACSLRLAVPESWSEVNDLAALRAHTVMLGRPLRVATKYPLLTGNFLNRANIEHILISAEGTLETAPAIGYADIISDLVSSGQTLRDNRLKPLQDGLIQDSQAALIANRQSLKNNPAALQMARQLLEYFEAHLRASEELAIFANIRGASPEAIAELIFTQPTIAGLQGPTISRVVVRSGDPNWYAVNIIVPRARLFQAVNELRAIGGSGVVVMPVSYIFEEEPPRYSAMLRMLEER
ncbi:MAG TPA: ATP phosphoribosyltransferase [Anaerolinea thermolimosa]|uniref:ATP phosphoribosyltransferase n=1 Tax=Anaerolinea thermolimosa TaxID=229919 RepID=A0A3D1JHV0_9CHLR|nr:ATP phosphoribosyltransferase [Anaerolinea thermolimosa]GAP07229.1 ATP phosphoribosyltransferase [Anaerolinea thermolimosa]HCE17196.1 ATP phosphoribosyltransferase [Anaerolinea thermolimosa]